MEKHEIKCEVKRNPSPEAKSWARALTSTTVRNADMSGMIPGDQVLNAQMRRLGCP